MKTQETWNSQILKKTKIEDYISYFQNLLQNHSNEDSVELT